MRNHLLERKHPLEASVVIYDIHIINVVKIFRLMPHLLQAVGHRKILVYLYEFCTHKTAGGILVILEEIHDVARLLHVLDIEDDLFAVFLVEFLNKVYGIVGVEQVYEMTDLLRIHILKEFLAILLVEFHKDIGFLLLIVYKVECPFSLFYVKALEEFCDIRGMKTGERIACPHFIAMLDHLFDKLYIFFIQIFHFSCQLLEVNSSQKLIMERGAAEKFPQQRRGGHLFRRNSLEKIKEFQQAVSHRILLLSVWDTTQQWLRIILHHSQFKDE